MYTSHNLRITHNLLLDWTGWLSEQVPFPSTTAELIEATRNAWEKDGLTLVHAKVAGDEVQILFQADPKVAPTFLAGRAKGRLQHALRAADTPVKFSRKVSVRSLGDNTRTTVENYLQHQVLRGDFADPRFQERMKRYTRERADVDLAEPTPVTSGRYWYNLHLVLVSEDRFRFGEDRLLSRLRDEALHGASDFAHATKSVSVMPDHIHIALRGCEGKSALEIGVDFQNRLARVVGCRAWAYPFYAGTFSEYDVRAITGKPS